MAAANSTVRSIDAHREVAAAWRQKIVMNAGIQIETLGLALAELTPDFDEPIRTYFVSIALGRRIAELAAISMRVTSDTILKSEVEKIEWVVGHG